MPVGDAAYTCSDITTTVGSAEETNSGVDVDNFWSTSAVDTASGRPLANLLLDGQVQDMSGQVMPVGEQAPLMFLAHDSCPPARTISPSHGKWYKLL